MGDQVGDVVEGSLIYVPLKEFERILSLPINDIDKVKIFASICRINTLYMIARAGSGHIGSSFSSMDIISWIELHELNGSTSLNSSRDVDIFFSSKGHDAPAMYSVWLGLGKLDFELIHQLRKINGLPGHPDISLPGVITNTGSLGMGVSKAKGIIFANRFKSKFKYVYVLTGDGELQEGQFWESLISAANNNLSELIVIIDHNKLQSDTFISNVSDLGDLEAKLKSFGWHVSRCDGNNVDIFSKTLSKIKRFKDKPKIIIADTIKGKGVSFMEHNSVDSDVDLYKYHSGAPTAIAYNKASSELISNTNRLLESFNCERLQLELVEQKPTASIKNKESLITAYSNSLLEKAKDDSNIVVLDADLVLDTGLLAFKKMYPERFIECGIAEQDMVSQAGGIALNGLLPIVHSFSCFLSSRPNEQIYNNATECTKIVYVGSLAGITPAGPGHSHQAVRDISSLSAIPNLVLIEPSCEVEVKKSLDWALYQNNSCSYIRLCSLPVEIPYTLPIGYKPEIGKGHEIISGDDVAIVAYGPVMLTNAVHASKILEEQYSVNCKVINMPWLNHVNIDWFNEYFLNLRTVICIDNHYKIGGLYDRLNDALNNAPEIKLNLVSLSVEEIPFCGTNDEVLKAHKFDILSMVKKVLYQLRN
jgi:transketolase